MSNDTGITNNYEAMRQELIDAGYTEDANGFWRSRNGFLAAYSAIFPSIDSAYRHLQEVQYFEALEVFVSKVANADFTATDLRIKGAAAYRKEAAAILAQYPKAE